MSRQPAPAPGPLSRRVDVASIRDGSLALELQASPAEREAVAVDCGIPGVDALAADLKLSREMPDRIRVTGRVTARIRQICVVSLDEFASDIEESVDISFAPLAEVDALTAARAARPAPEDDEADLPDPIVGGRIDVGAVVAEALALGLDPYPRKPGIVFSEPEDAPVETPEVSPFNVLRALKGHDKP